MRIPVLLALALVAGPAAAQQPAPPVVPQIIDDSIPHSLTGQPGDAAAFQMRLKTAPDSFDFGQFWHSAVFRRIVWANLRP